MLSTEKIQNPSCSLRKELERPNWKTLAATLSGLFCQSSAGESLYQNSFAHQWTYVKEHHPAEKLEMQVSLLSWAKQSSEASSSSFHRLQLVQKRHEGHSN